MAQRGRENESSVCVSAPGKVLITGGYLVLDQQYAGLVLASTARFYARASSSSAAQSAQASSVRSEQGAGGIEVTIESPQFDQVIRGVLRRGAGDAYQFVVSESSDRNAYIEETLLCAINGIEGVAPASVARKAEELRGANAQLHVLLQADNDFYSQVKRLQRSGQSLHRRNLAALQKCLPPFMEEKPNGEKVAMKTGMGSSAALVTSLVGALVRFFLPANRFEERDDDLEIIHNLAQLSHCFVQRKIGSGFDVSAACFGSQRYTRFPASVLDAFTTPEALKPAALRRCLQDRSAWDVARRVKPFKLPLSLCLFMGDVSAGSATVSMVRQVLSWQKAQPEEAKRVISSLNEHNSHVEAGFAELLALLESSQQDMLSFEKARSELAQCTFDQWERIDPVLGHTLCSIREEFLVVRSLLREMGELAGVPVEPAEQTVLVDATMAVPGVLIAGVPGAGGYDAVFVVALDACVLDRVEELWVQWPQTHPESTYVHLNM
ncbi:hypothetical protein Gpo141_00004293 [Globisporangium polare]